MKRLEFSEKKALALEFIAKISEGYRLTGPNKAFDEAMRGKEAVITQSCLYQFIRGDEELSQAYFKARDESRKRIMGGARQLGMEKRKELLALIIENMSKGMNIRGDTYRANAVVEACRVLELLLVHWATVHRWLRTENKDLQESYRAALNSAKNKLHACAACGKITTGKKHAN
jgi:rubrerythrin